VVTGASETTKLVVAATNNEQWGPTGPQMRQIADLTFNYGDCTLVMEAIWERLETDLNYGANWRIMYKALLLLDYIIRNGSERIVNDARQNIYQIKGLSMVQNIDSEGIDRGVSIRERSKQVVELLGDTVRLRDERKKCKQNRDKYSTAYGNEPVDYRYNSGRNPSFDDEDFPNRRTQRTTFTITEADFQDDFKDDTPHKPIPRANTRPVQPQTEDDFEPFVEPTVTPNVVAPAIPKANSNTNINTGTQANWDPFSPAPTPTPATPNNWDDFNPRGTTDPSISAWPSQPSRISPPINTHPVIPSNPVGPSIGVTNTRVSNTQSPTISANLFVNNANPPSNPILPSNNTIPPNLFVNNANSNLPSNPALSSSAPKTNTVPPLKSNDPWAAQHLFNLSPSPRNNTTTSTSTSTNAKPLGATVGPGWGIPNSTPNVPPAVYTYPNTINMTYPVTYATYPVSTTTNMFSTQNYSNTSQWGI